MDKINLYYDRKNSLFINKESGKSLKLEDLKIGKYIIIVNDLDEETKSFQDPILDYLTTFDNLKIKCRKNKDEFFDYSNVKNFIDVANILKLQSKCTRLKVCCLLVNNNHIISTGINGSPFGYKNCNDQFSYIDISKPSYYIDHHKWSEQHEVHAELNALLELGKTSCINNYNNLELYCSTCPCPSCAKMIAQSNIKTVFYHNSYDRIPEGENLLKEFGIDVIKF